MWTKATEGQTPPPCPLTPQSLVCVALREAHDPSELDITISSTLLCLTLLWVYHCYLGTALPTRTCVWGGLVQRGRSWGVELAASRAPSWVDAGKVSGWESFQPLKPEPGRIRVLTESLRVTSSLTSAPPPSAGQLVMDASWPQLCFILFFP